MPCYKAEHTLAKSIEGVVNQTHANWELLLLIDGSPDGTLEIAQAWGKIDKRIRVINASRNRGVIRMRNLGIRLARGRWIAFCDSDDWWLPQKLESQLQLASASQANLVCSGFYYHFGASKQDRAVLLPSNLSYQSMLRTNGIAMSTAVFDRMTLGRHYFHEMPFHLIHEDYAFWIELFKSQPVKAVCWREASTYIRVQPGSRSSNKWLAIRSHAYVLRQNAGLSVFRLLWHLGSYATVASLKRLGRLR